MCLDPLTALTDSQPVSPARFAVPPCRSPRGPWPQFLLLGVITCCGVWLSLANPVFAQDAEPAAPAPAAAAPAVADGPAAEETARPAGERSKGIPTTPEELINALGWIYVVPFVLASIISVWFGIERIVVLRKGRVIPRHFVERFRDHLREGKLTPRRALELCHENGSPMALIFEHGIRKWGKPSVEVEQAIIDGGERQVSRLRKHLRVINGVATVTPLIGLLGTVTGMIQSFNEIASADAMGNAQRLGGGIAVALLTTAIGLAIAIPSLIMYMYLSGCVDTLVMEMDHIAQDVVHLISAEGLAQRAASKPSAAAGSSASKSSTAAVKAAPKPQPPPQKRAV